MPANRTLRHAATVSSLMVLALLSGCGSQRKPAPEPEDVRGEIVRLLPAHVADRQGWATDIYAAFEAQHIDPTHENICSVLAVAEQESNFQVDPPVPGMGTIARDDGGVLPFVHGEGQAAFGVADR